MTEKSDPSSETVPHFHDSNPRITSFLLNKQNYIPWARQARVSLKGRGKLGFIDGSDKRPDKNPREWDMNDSQVMTWITSSMEPELAQVFVFCETSKELWEEIKKIATVSRAISHKSLS